MKGLIVEGFCSVMALRGECYFPGLKITAPFAVFFSSTVVSGFPSGILDSMLFEIVGGGNCFVSYGLICCVCPNAGITKFLKSEKLVAHLLD